MVTFVETYKTMIEYGKTIAKRGYELMENVQGLGVEAQLSELETICRENSPAD